MKREYEEQMKAMHMLMERMDKHYTLNEAEELSEKLDARDREDVDTAEFFDMIGQMKGGAKATIGYVSSARLNIPQVKKKNPETNRMKNYDDWETFGKQMGVEDVAGVVKFASYNLSWRSPSNMTKHYNSKYVEPANAIRAKYGISPIAKREPYTQTLSFGNGVSAYNGGNEELMGHSYSPQDTAGAKTNVEYYLVNSQGNIIKEVSAAELKPYFKEVAPSGIGELKKLNKSDEEIAAYAKEIASLNFRYMQFEHSSVVYVITSINGEKKRYFNKNLTNALKGITINPQEFLSKAKERYQIDSENVDSSNSGEFDDEYADALE